MQEMLDRDPFHRGDGRGGEHALIIAAVFEGMKSAICTVDSSLMYTTYNSAHVRAMDELYGVEIAHGASVLESITVAEDRTRIGRNIGQAMSGMAVSVEEHWGDPRLARKPHDVTYAPLKTRDGRIEGVSIVFSELQEFLQPPGNPCSCHLEQAESPLGGDAPSRVLTICSYCKNIRDGRSDWVQLESHLYETHGIEFSHGICRDCLEKALAGQTS